MTPHAKPVFPTSTEQPLRRVTVEEYHRMNEAGILMSGEPYELIGGLIVLKDRSAVGEDRMTVGREHIWCVKNLGRLDKKLQRMGCHMQLQSPVIMSSLDEPEPDGAILRGGIDDYKQRKAEASDAYGVIEVADSSLAHDRTEKLALYANSGITRYIIINLPDRVVEVYTDPQIGRGHYGRVETLRAGGKVQIAVVGSRTLEAAVRSLLP
jgi:Uma2 family endonuclease